VRHDSESVAGFLRIEEAEMLSELLASQGIDSWVEGAVASVLAPVLPGMGGGARLLVSPADAARAREIIARSGVFRGEDGPATEIPEQEWARFPPPPGVAEPGRAPAEPGRKTFLLYPAAVIALVTAATALCLLAER
jgi:hypothetical protein